MEEMYRIHKEPAWGWIGALLEARKSAATQRAAKPTPTLRPLEKGRVLYALGYRPWHAPTGPWRRQRTGFLARVRRAASRRQAKLADRLSTRFGRTR